MTDEQEPKDALPETQQEEGENDTPAPFGPTTTKESGINPKDWKPYHGKKPKS